MHRKNERLSRDQAKAKLNGTPNEAPENVETEGNAIKKENLAESATKMDVPYSASPTKRSSSKESIRPNPRPGSLSKPTIRPCHALLNGSDYCVSPLSILAANGTVSTGTTSSANISTQRGFLMNRSNSRQATVNPVPPQVSAANKVSAFVSQAMVTFAQESSLDTYPMVNSKSNLKQKSNDSIADSINKGSTSAHDSPKDVNFIATASISNTFASTMSPVKISSKMAPCTVTRPVPRKVKSKASLRDGTLAVKGKASIKENLDLRKGNSKFKTLIPMPKVYKSSEQLGKR